MISRILQSLTWHGETEVQRGIVLPKVTQLGQKPSFILPSQHFFFPNHDKLIAGTAKRWEARLRDTLSVGNIYWNNAPTEIGGVGLGNRCLDSGLLSATNMLCGLGQVNQPLWASGLISTDERQGQNQMFSKAPVSCIHVKRSSHQCFNDILNIMICGSLISQPNLCKSAAPSR